jgi:hypothetical protein
VLGCALGLAGLSGAEDPTPTPAPTRTPTPTPTSPPQTVAEAARRARAAAEVASTPTRTPIVISNENLAELAARGHLTEVTSTSQNTPPDAGNTAGESSREDQAESKKAYWRGRYKAQKDVVEAIKAEIADLDTEIPGLWNQFYAWDDPAYRDGVIKVRLDEALARREELAKQLPEEEAKLPEILGEARRDGALPGWFRDLK